MAVSRLRDGDYCPNGAGGFRQALAAAYAAEALAGETDLTLTETIWDEEAGEVTVCLDWQGETLRASVTV